MAQKTKSGISILPRGRKGWRRFFIRWMAVISIVFVTVYTFTAMPGKSYSGSLSPLDGEGVALKKRLKGHVVRLSQTIRQRSFYYYDELQESARYIKGAFGELGGSMRTQEFECQGKMVENIILEFTGAGRPEEIIVVAAHYDSVLGSTGADDNATGVAALLETGRFFSGKGIQRTLRLVAVVNEEPPFFQTENMGSLVYARSCKKNNDSIKGMISLESLGYYRHEPGSQKYPPFFSSFYPDKGNFIGFVGNISSRKLLKRALKTFRENEAFPSEGVFAPSRVPGIGWSDHWAFWTVGYPAIMVTDTVPYRNPHYHTMEDTPDTLDFDGMTRVVNGLFFVIRDLLGEKSPGTGEKDA